MMQLGKEEWRQQTVYGMLLDAIAQGTLVINAEGVVTAPQEVPRALMRHPDALKTPRARQLLVAHALANLPMATTVTGLQKILAHIAAQDSPTTTFEALPVVQVCVARAEAMRQSDMRRADETVQNAYRMVRNDGGLVIAAEEGWQPSDAALDIVATYHYAHYLLESPGDAQGFTQLVAFHVDRLSLVVLWDYVSNVLSPYIDTGFGDVTLFLDPTELREFGRKLFARGAFQGYLADYGDEGMRLLKVRGFVDA